MSDISLVTRDCNFRSRLEGAPSVRLLLDVERRLVQVDGRPLSLPPQEFALLATYARAAHELWSGAGPGGVGAGHRGWILTRDFLDTGAGRRRPLAAFLAFYEVALGYRERQGLEHVRRLARDDILGLQAFFQRKRSYLRRFLSEAGPDFAVVTLSASRCKPHRAGLRLPAKNIRFV